MSRRVAAGRVRRLETLAAAGLAASAPRWAGCGCCAGLALGGGHPADGPWRPVGKALVLGDEGDGRGRSYGTCYRCGTTILAELARDARGGWVARGAERASLPL